MHGASKKFASELCKIGAPWCDAAKFLQHVDCGTECGSLCRTTSFAARQRLQKLILAALTRFTGGVAAKPLPQRRSMAILDAFDPLEPDVVSS